MHLRQLGECGFGVLERLLGAAAGSADQSRGKAFLVIEQDFQEVFGFELLVVGAKCQLLRSLNETARTLGEFLDVHICLSSTSPRPHMAAGSESHVNKDRPPSEHRTHDLCVVFLQDNKGGPPKFENGPVWGAMSLSQRKKNAALWGGVRCRRNWLT